MILVNDPYFNEPGYESSRNTPQVGHAHCHIQSNDKPRSTLVQSEQRYTVESKHLIVMIAGQPALPRLQRQHHALHRAARRLGRAAEAQRGLC